MDNKEKSSTNSTRLKTAFIGVPILVFLLTNKFLTLILVLGNNLSNNV
jgi:hypothetical protein